MKQKANRLLSFVLAIVMAAGMMATMPTTTSAASEKPLSSGLISTSNFNLRDLTSNCEYNYSTESGFVHVRFTVDGPNNLCDSRIASYFIGFMPSSDQITNSISSVVNHWQEIGLTISAKHPSFKTGGAFSVEANDMGTAIYVLFVGLDENINEVGWALIRVDVPPLDELLDEISIIDSGNFGAYGDNLTWELDNRGVLTIRGAGAMANDDGNVVGSWSGFSHYYNEIEKIVIKEGVTTISKDAFRGLGNVYAVELPQSLQKINSASLQSDYLHEVTIPRSVTSLSGGAFTGENLIIKIEEGNAHYKAKNGAVFSMDDTVLVQAPSARYFHPEGATNPRELYSNVYTVPNTVAEIGPYAFGWWFSEITLPDSVRRIGEGAFGDGFVQIGGNGEYLCTKVNLSNNLEYVALGAFTTFRQKEGLGFTNIVEYNGSYYIGNAVNPYLILVETVERQSDQTSLQIHPSTRVIQGGEIGGIYNWRNLNDLYFDCSEEVFQNLIRTWGEADSEFGYIFHRRENGSVVKSIRGAGYCGASENGKNLAWEVTSDGTLRITGQGQMADYDDGIAPWKEVVLYERHTDGSWSGSPIPITKLELSDGVTYLGGHAFSELEIVSASIPAGVEIGEYAFASCNNLTTLSLSSGAKVGPHAFASCTGLKSLTISEGVTEIGDMAFVECDLTSLALPNSLKYLGENAFGYCDNLTSVTMGTGLDGDYHSDSSGWRYQPFHNSPVQSLAFTSPSGGLGSIPNNLFRDAKNLTSVYIPDGVQTIGEDAFYGCTALEAVTIPGSVTEIGARAFASCDNLTNVTVDLNTLSKASGMYYLDMGFPFMDSPVETLTVTCDGSGDTTLSGHAIAYLFNSDNDSVYDWTNNNIQTIVVSSGITSIKDAAFYGCKGLKELYLPKSLTSISKYCVEDSWASSVDVYFEGSDEQWHLMTMFGNDAAAPLHKVKMHYGVTTRPIGGGGGSGNSDPSTRVEFMGGIYNKDNQRITMDIKWNFDLFNKSSKTRNQDMMIASLVLSANAYDPILLDKTLKKLGFENFISKNYDDLPLLNPESHVAFGIASKELPAQNIIVIVCRGTANAQEWQQNILTSANGFGVAALEVKDWLDKYLELYKIDTSKKTKILITGHSRGGAVANWLGASASLDENNTFVYTFACPNTTLSPGNYEHIHNITNIDDFVPTVPPFFGKFGIEYGFKTDNAPNFEDNFYAIAGVSRGVLDNPFSWFDCGSDSYPFPFRNHAPATYMAALLGNVNLYKGGYNIKRISVKCPVDVLVYDMYDQLLGKIENNVPDDDLFTNGIYAVVEGDEKYLYTTKSAELKIELVGTDSGYMEYSVQVIDTETDDVVEEKVFSNVVLTAGKTMTSGVSGDILVPDTQLYVVNNDSDTIAKVLEDGTEVPVEYTVTVTDGTASLSKAKAGDTVTVTANTKSGYTFKEWSVTGGAVTLADKTKATTTFTMPAENVTLAATYTKDNTPTPNPNPGGGGSGGGGGTAAPTTYTVTPAKMENGSVIISPENAKPGETVTVTSTPNTGYETDTVTVIDKDGKTVSVTKNSDGTYSFTMPNSKVNVTATFKAIESANPFTDVAKGAYYYDAVLWAVGHDPQITNGTSAATFSPDATCTRGQVVTFLWRAAGCPEATGSNNPFADVKADAYYYKAVLWAVENGITKGTGETAFSPEQACTRGQVVTFLHRFENTPEPDSTANPFTDVKADAYYYDAVLWAVGHTPQITNGTSATTFSPDDTCTRGQIVTFLYRDMGGK